MSPTETDNEVRRFIINAVDSIPFLEALLLLFREQKEWNADNLGKRLYVNKTKAQNLLTQLESANLIALKDGENLIYQYQQDHDAKDRLIAKVESAYAKNLIEITKMIHDKKDAVKQFSEAFKL